MKRAIRLSACLLALLLCAACGKPTLNDVEHNVGSAHLEHIDGEPVPIADLIPSQQNLTTALKDKGYNVQEYEIKVNGESAQWVYAELNQGEKKDPRVVDITYCQTEEQAKEKFEQYRALYYTDPPKFYLLAQNERWVYCFSDKQAFEDAGFFSLANHGEQYLIK